MGDMLVKNGQPALARQVYATAMLSQSYASWPYRSLFEARMAQAESRAHQFQAADPPQHPEILFNSAHSCTACHAQ